MKYSIEQLLALPLVAAIAVAIITASLACKPIRKLDEAVWGTPETPAEKEPGEAPPILEVLAAALAALGYGGMAGWIHRNRKLDRKTAEGLMKTLQQHIDGNAHPNP